MFGTDGIFKLLYGLALRASHPDKYERLREIEAKARSVRQYYLGCFVPGLLQTPDYVCTV